MLCLNILLCRVPEDALLRSAHTVDSDQLQSTEIIRQVKSDTRTLATRVHSNDQPMTHLRLLVMLVCVVDTWRPGARVDHCGGNQIYRLEHIEKY